MMKFRLSLVLVVAGVATWAPWAGSNRVSPTDLEGRSRANAERPALPATQDATQAQNPAEIAALVKAATAKFKKPELQGLLNKLQDKLKEAVPAYSAETGWIPSIHTFAARFTTPVETVPNEFGPIRSVSAKTGHPPVVIPPAMLQPRSVMYRFGSRDYWWISDEVRKSKDPDAKTLAPADQLTWVLSGHPPDAEAAISVMQRDLDIDRSRDKLSRFLEYWRNGKESFYQALDRTAGTTEAVFFYDAMLGEFVDRVSPNLQKSRTLSEKHDRLHTAFLTLRNYRRFIEAVSLELVSTEPFPTHLKELDYSVVAGAVQVRDGMELVIAANDGDVVATFAEIKALMAAHPMPDELWGKYEPSTFFIDWARENALKIRARIKAHDLALADLPDYELAVRCRRKRQDIQATVRETARAFLQERGVAGAK